MPLPPIVVDVAQAEQKPAMAQALLDACSRAASPTPCAMPSEADEEQAFAVAIVVWLDNGDAVRVQVGLRSGEQKGEWLTRRVQFDASDDETERWTATGFVVGTLAGRFVEEREPEPPDSDAPAPTEEPLAPAAPDETPAPEAPPERPAARQAHTELFVDLGALARPQFSKGPWGLGALVGVEYMPSGWPVFLHGGTHASYRRRDQYGIASYFGDVDLGVGVPIARLSEDWELRGAWSLGLQRMLVRVRQPSSGLKDSAARWLGGARVEFAVDWMPTRNFGGFASVGAVWWWGSTDIEIGDDLVQEQPTLLGEAALGLRFRAL